MAFLNGISPWELCHTFLRALRSEFSWEHPHTENINFANIPLLIFNGDLMNWMACTLFLLMITVSNIMARFLVACRTFFCVNCFVRRFMNEVAFSILDCRTELFVASFVISLALRFICRVALCLYLILVDKKYLKILRKSKSICFISH